MAKTSAERQAAYRARLNANKPARTLEPCPSPAAYQRHLRHGEEACAGCKHEWNKYNRKGKRSNGR